MTLLTLISCRGAVRTGGVGEGEWWWWEGGGAGRWGEWRGRNEGSGIWDQRLRKEKRKRRYGPRIKIDDNFDFHIIKPLHIISCSSRCITVWVGGFVLVFFSLVKNFNPLNYL
jgi:hypothetical protein